ncbi:hypothetical protein QX220_22250 [Vibrio vulnificus]|uniref:hypothetical protein n=1 Tax=Vibrio TaxID=662 RepID=UPI000418481F|nr:MULTISPECIES: hypothetical protein [Vibrio]EGR1749469.1 hypothetical protein [Vibrio parahaemolyticus]EIS4858217.1 hypothetical protein [Vibrio parahaemolyticus]ELP6759789.1 hypothetical protein [Vibrio vulnificus]MDS1864338.1 hypothetical protein [Vibrio vulnificus]HAS6391759.1 hypothetical protein [Vibrio vulnificus]
MTQTLDEVRGRLFLWYCAIEKSYKLLELESKTIDDSQNSFNSDDMKLIQSSSVELAIIYFCQIVNKGNSDSNKVANNDRNFRQRYWRTWLDFTFEKAELEHFNEMVKQIQFARDQMLGHADGRAFEVQHVGAMTVMKRHDQSWKEIDLVFWKQCMKKMLGTFGDLARTIS